MARTGLKFNPGMLPSNYSSGILAAGGGVIVNDGPVRLIRLLITNKDAVQYYIQLFDSATLPADTTVPDAAPIVAQAGPISFSSDYGAQNEHGGRSFTKGLAWCVSSTFGTKTIVAAANVWVEAQWE